MSTNLLPVTAPPMEPSQWAKKSAFYCRVITRQLCDDTHLPRWLSTSPVHSQTFKPTPANFYTHKQPTITFNELQAFLRFGGFPWSSAQPNESITRLILQRVAGASKGHPIPIDYGCHHGKMLTSQWILYKVPSWSPNCNLINYLGIKINPFSDSALM